MYLYGAPSPVKIVCRGLELFPLENTTRNGPFREPRQACLPSSYTIFSEENIHALTITMRVIPARFGIMVAGRANHRNDKEGALKKFRGQAFIPLMVLYSTAKMFRREGPHGL